MGSGEELVKHEMMLRELREENFRLKNQVASFEAGAKADQSKLEINKLRNEKDRLIIEIDEWHAKHNKSQRDLKEQKEENEELREQLRKFKGILDELEERNNAYQKKLKDAEQEVYENNKKESKLVSIEDMISKLNTTLIANKEGELKEASMKEAADKEELAGYKKSYKRFGNLLKRLMQALLKDQKLKNSRVQELFKFGNVSLDSKDKYYKSLLKLLAALYYVNKSQKTVRDAFNKWKQSLPTISASPAKEKSIALSKEPVVELSRRPIISNESPHSKSFEDFEFDLSPYELNTDDLLKEYRPELEALKKTPNNNTFNEIAPIIYYRIINGMAKYFFKLYLIILKDAKLKRK